jgi:hypothetical protein
VRKTKIVRIEAEGRDRGKHFLITEMDAMRAEKWAMQALLAMGRGGVNVPDDVLTSGAIGILASGLSSIARLPFEDARPLLDEMLTCISFVPDPSKRDVLNPERPISRPLILDEAMGDADIQEVATLLFLRKEVAELHLGFSFTAALSTLAEQWTSSLQRPLQTSRKASARPSRRASPRSTNAKAATA